jgi:hypothetical protein
MSKSMAACARRPQGGLEAVGADLSYSLRLAGSLSTSYACEISLNLASASLRPPLRSGCHFSAWQTKHHNLCVQKKPKEAKNTEQRKQDAGGLAGVASGKVTCGRGRLTTFTTHNANIIMQNANYLFLVCLLYLFLPRITHQCYILELDRNLDENVILSTEQGDSTL